MSQPGRSVFRVWMPLQFNQKPISQKPLRVMAPSFFCTCKKRTLFFVCVRVCVCVWKTSYFFLSALSPEPHIYMHMCTHVVWLNVLVHTRAFENSKGFCVCSAERKKCSRVSRRNGQCRKLTICSGGAKRRAEKSSFLKTPKNRCEMSKNPLGESKTKTKVSIVYYSTISISFSRKNVVFNIGM